MDDDGRRMTRRTIPLTVAAVLFAALAFAGCSSDLRGPNHLIVVQNKFAPDTCEQVMSKLKTTQARIAELENLSRKAKQDAGGHIISATVYGPDLATAYADQRQLHRARATKNCGDPAPVSQTGPTSPR